MLLPDTSIWITYLRRGGDRVSAELGAALDRDQVLACGPVVAELVAGARPEDRQALLDAMGGLPWADLGRESWGRVGLLAAELRGRGEALPLTDLEIAVAAHMAGATLWTSDRDFERLVPLLDGLELQLAA